MSHTLINSVHSLYAIDGMVSMMHLSLNSHITSSIETCMVSEKMSLLLPVCTTMHFWQNTDNKICNVLTLVKNEYPIKCPQQTK